jgi:hypothetical protein
MAVHFRIDGATVSGLSVGNHTVSFKSINGGPSAIEPNRERGGEQHGDDKRHLCGGSADRLVAG